MPSTPRPAFIAASFINLIKAGGTKPTTPPEQAEVCAAVWAGADVTVDVADVWMEGGGCCAVAGSGGCGFDEVNTTASTATSITAPIAMYIHFWGIMRENGEFFNHSL
jgi:hypothetical protein